MGDTFVSVSMAQVRRRTSLSISRCSRRRHRDVGVADTIV